MKTKLRVGVLFGGRSGEHEVSLVSAAAIIDGLDPEKYDVVPIGITKEGRWLSSNETLALLRAGRTDSSAEMIVVPDPAAQGLVALGSGNAAGAKLDVVFPVLHGTFGEDGAVQGLLELAGIPYVGAGVLGSALGMDKIAQKRVFRDAGLPVVDFLWFTARDWKRDSAKLIERIAMDIGFPCFAKPANTGSSVGISKVHSKDEIAGAAAEALRYDRRILFESGVPNAREIECAVLGNDAPEASVPGEIVPSNEFYDYDAKYVDGASTMIIPAELSAEQRESIRAMAARAFVALDCAGMARVDFFVRRDTGDVVLNEINTIPGFTPFSMYPKLWEASGVPYRALLDKLVALALERHRENSALARSYTPRSQWYE
jgi:D-alanine-D-alanine ligase